MYKKPWNNNENDRKEFIKFEKRFKKKIKNLKKCFLFKNIAFFLIPKIPKKIKDFKRL